MAQSGPTRGRALFGLRFALAVVVRAAPAVVALDALITLAEALAPLCMLQGTRLLLGALAAGRPPWPGLALLAAGECIPAFGSRVLYGPLGAALTRRIEATLRPRLMATLATMPWIRLEAAVARDQLSRADSGSTAVDVAWDSGSAFVRDVGRALSALGFLATVSPWAALCAVAALVPTVLLRRAAAAEWEGVRLAQLPVQRLAGYLFGLLTGRGTAAEVRLFGYAGHIRERWRQAYGRVQGAELDEQARTAWRGQFAALTATGLMLLSAALVPHRGGAAATASGIWALLTAFQQTTDLGYWVGSLAQEGFDAANLAEVLAWGRPLRPWRRPSRVTRGAGLRAGAPEPEALAALHSVAFTYPGASRPAVHDLTLQVRGGEHLALVGRNGSGKSTAVKLLLGLLAPDAGTALPARRAGVALQDFGRYALTAAENVALGRPSQMHARTRIAGALAAVGLPLAPEQPLGRHLRGGVEPSGGQWQRLALARALRSGAPLLVLDEPTAALDPLAEARLYEDFARLAASRTVVLVTHRLAAARLAGRILVFEDGRVVQEGTHDGLLADGGGLYARLWAAQSGWAR